MVFSASWTTLFFAAATNDRQAIDERFRLVNQLDSKSKAMLFLPKYLHQDEPGRKL